MRSSRRSRNASAAAYSPSPGVIYPTLTLLEELGYVTVGTAGEGGRKLHEVTDQGRAFLEANRPTLDALLARMDEAGRAQGGGPAPQIVRAMENLKLALRMRMAARSADRGPGRCGGRRARRGGDRGRAQLMATPSQARVPTAVPRRYLGQLCKHFQHRLAVELTETRGRIEFPMGVCTLDAEAAAGHAADAAPRRATTRRWRGWRMSWAGISSASRFAMR